MKMTELETQKITAKNKQPVITKDIVTWLKDNYADPSVVGYGGTITTKLDIRHLWDNKYRLNYWGKKDKNSDINVIWSIFAVITKKNNKYILVNESEGELRS